MLYFIVNRTSSTGNSNKIWKKVIYILNKKSIEYKPFYTEYKGHARIIAKKLSFLDEEKIHIVIVGGDGTINEVINGITDFSKVCISIIPAGSGNDFANGLGITKDIETNLDNILNNDYEKHDLGIVYYGDNKKRYFGISSGIGLDALVCKKVNKSFIKRILNALKLGKLTYLVLTVQSLFSLKTVSGKVMYDNAYVKKYSNLIFSAGMNMTSEGGGVPIAPGASSQDGNITFCLAHDISKYKAFFALPFLITSKHEKLKCFDIVNCSNAKMITKIPVALHADGEYLGDVMKVKFVCKKDSLKLIK